ncbi:hypothetical protein ACH5A7_34505 [Streptomyces sp. NPDC018955]|uniref:hypothetical protein n=1 Tax=Streptomyces sp. NPDC018955 TaxID=3365055 RepID=UPI0037921D61
MNRLKSSEKSFGISKWEIREVFQEVKRNQGAPGVDEQSIADIARCRDVLTPPQRIQLAAAATEPPKDHTTL